MPQIRVMPKPQKKGKKQDKKLRDAKKKLDKAQAAYDAAVARSGSSAASAPNRGVLSYGSSLGWNFDTYGAYIEDSPLPPTVGGKSVYGPPAGAPNWIWNAETP